jgi:hypothetical protein
MIGRSDGAPILTLGTDDIHAAYERLRERGVRFLGEPYCYLWGIGALLWTGTEARSSYSRNWKNARNLCQAATVQTYENHG